MLKLPEEDRRMIRPETPRDDIRELKKFNKAAPEKGVADDIHELIKQFFEMDKEALKELYSQEAFLTGNVEKISQLVDIVNPSGTRTFKKGIYFLMMYEQNIKIKKFMGTPETMEWARFFEITKEIFGQQLSAPPEPAEEHPEEPKIEMLEPVQETPQEQQEPERVQAEKIEPEEKKNEDDSQMGTADTVSDEPRRAEEHSEKEKPVEQIAPAQMEEKHEENHSETGQKRNENEGKKEKPGEENERKIERLAYMQSLSVAELAEYIAEQYASGGFDNWKDSANRLADIRAWLTEKVKEGRTEDE